MYGPKKFPQYDREQNWEAVSGAEPPLFNGAPILPFSENELKSSPPGFYYDRDPHGLKNPQFNPVPGSVGPLSLHFTEDDLDSANPWLSPSEAFGQIKRVGPKEDLSREKLKTNPEKNGLPVVHNDSDQTEFSQEEPENRMSPEEEAVLIYEKIKRRREIMGLLSSYLAYDRKPTVPFAYGGGPIGIVPTYYEQYGEHYI
jgi:hypothetical protein